jgi:hypothetical protein
MAESGDVTIKYELDKSVRALIETFDKQLADLGKRLVSLEIGDRKVYSAKELESYANKVFKDFE